MNKSDLIEQVASRHEGRLAAGDVDAAVRNIVEQMTAALARRGRIEIRGFGSFSLHYLPPRRYWRSSSRGAEWWFPSTADTVSS